MRLLNFQPDLFAQQSQGDLIAFEILHVGHATGIDFEIDVVGRFRRDNVGDEARERFAQVRVTDELHVRLHGLRGDGIAPKGQRVIGRGENFCLNNIDEK